MACSLVMKSFCKVMLFCMVFSLHFAVHCAFWPLTIWLRFAAALSAVAVSATQLSAATVSAVALSITTLSTSAMSATAISAATLSATAMSYGHTVRFAIVLCSD